MNGVEFECIKGIDGDALAPDNWGCFRREVEDEGVRFIVSSRLRRPSSTVHTYTPSHSQQEPVPLVSGTPKVLRSDVHPSSLGPAPLR